jgi:hypothetical protein
VVASMPLADRAQHANARNSAGLTALHVWGGGGVLYV